MASRKDVDVIQNDTIPPTNRNMDDELKNKSALRTQQSEFLIYQAADGKKKIDIRLEDEIVWLTQDHMAELFGKAC